MNLRALNGVQCSFSYKIQTQNFNIYNISVVIIQT